MSANPPRPVPGIDVSEISLRETDDPDRWAAACRASGQPITPFHSYPWLDLAAGMTKTRFAPLIVWSHGADIGVAPWLTRRRGPVSTVNWLPFPYAGPLVPLQALGPTLRRLSRRALRERAIVQEFQFGPESLDRADVAIRGFQTRMDSTWLIDTTQTEDALFAALDKMSRKKIRQVQRQGFQIDASRDGGPILQHVISDIFARRGLRMPYPDNFPPDISRMNRNGLQVHWTVARHEKVEVGSMVALMYEGSAVAWVGGVLPEYQATNVNVLLHWEMIQWASAHGARSLDLVGIPYPGIDRFKSQFGGTRVDYPVLTKMAPGITPWRQLTARRRQGRLPSGGVPAPVEAKGPE